MKRKRLLNFFLIVTVAACAPQSQTVLEVEPTLTSFQPATNTPVPTPTSTPTPVTLTITPTPVPPTPTPTTLPPVSEEYLPYTIVYLRSRSYGGGQIEALDVTEEREKFTRYLIRYPSDGLNIYGYVNVPKGEGPFPLIIMLHGFARVNQYATLSNFVMADAFASNGYLVLHPDMRGYPPSDSGDNLYRVGLAVDVLNLIALVKEQANLPGWLENADITRIGLWGVSLGGGVALRVATVSEDIKAVLLHSSISGDEFKNAELFHEITESQINLTEMETPVEVMAYISPINYFDRVTASVKLYHGSLDESVPSAWAAETCDVMKANSVDIDCVYYLNCGHATFSKCQPEFNNEVLAFFERHLKEP
jgi:dipeptidyl aminopeptidase/acylaminoacyl peptidase